jgi:hypothetical protein
MNVDNIIINGNLELIESLSEQEHDAIIQEMGTDGYLDINSYPMNNPECRANFVAYFNRIPLNSACKLFELFYNDGVKLLVVIYKHIRERVLEVLDNQLEKEG